jgi:hypothetical protein
MSIKNLLPAAAAMAVLTCASAVAVAADDHAYTEGPVIQVTSIRTVDGKFDEYVKWLDTVWKAENEAAKKAGYIVSYAVYSAEAHSAQDPDLMLVITYKNWAALDGGLAKNDAVAKQIEGSVAAASKSQSERAKIRTVLGTETLQEMKLK